jgi:hypothetical protein
VIGELRPKPFDALRTANRSFRQPWSWQLIWRGCDGVRPWGCGACYRACQLAVGAPF